MGKPNKSGGEGKRRPETVRIAKALAYGWRGFDAKTRVVLFLAVHADHSWSPQGGMDEWAVTMGMHRITLWRALRELLADGVVEHDFISDTYLIPNRVIAEAEAFYQDRLSIIRSMRDVAGVQRRRRDLATSMLQGRNISTPSDQGDRPHTGIEQGVDKSANAAVPSGHGAKEAISVGKKQPEEAWLDRTFGDDPDAPPPPRRPKGKSPTTRLRYAFEDECRRLKDYWGVPITPSVKQMMGGIKWLLDQGYPEDEIRDSFRYLPNVLGRQSVGTHRTMWEVYYQNKAELLQLGAQDKVGRRPGEKPESLLDVARRKNRAVH